MKKYVVLLIFLFLLLYGTARKEFSEIYVNAKIICLSCIGIGR